jgi:hypothetical protein
MEPPGYESYMEKIMIGEQDKSNSFLKFFIIREDCRLFFVRTGQNGEISPCLMHLGSLNLSWY